MPLVKDNGFILVWGSLVFSWYYLSSPPQVLRVPVVHLELRGLTWYARRTARAAPFLVWFTGTDRGWRWGREGEVHEPYYHAVPVHVRPYPYYYYYGTA